MNLPLGQEKTSIWFDQREFEAFYTKQTGEWVDIKLTGGEAYNGATSDFKVTGTPEYAEFDELLDNLWVEHADYAPLRSLTGGSGFIDAMLNKWCQDGIIPAGDYTLYYWW